MSEFEPAIELVLKHEGGYTAGLPGDPGGETNFGISHRAYPQLDLKNLTVEGAKAIYQRNYWKPWMEQEPDQRVANCALDCAVNQGSTVANTLYVQFGHSLKEFQLARLLRYAALGKPQFNHSWFQRTLDV